MVEQVVIVMDKGTSARASSATTFDATPPGQHPTRHTPAACAGGRPHSVEARTADAGITQNCARKPTATGLGRVAMRRKSLVSSVVPIASIVTASAAVTWAPSNRKSVGPRGVAPTRAAPATRAGKESVIRLPRPIVIGAMDALSGAVRSGAVRSGGVRRAAAKVMQRERRSIALMTDGVQAPERRSACN